MRASVQKARHHLCRIQVGQTTVPLQLLCVTTTQLTAQALAVEAWSLFEVQRCFHRKLLGDSALQHGVYAHIHT